MSPVETIARYVAKQPSSRADANNLSAQRHFELLGLQRGSRGRFFSRNYSDGFFEGERMDVINLQLSLLNANWKEIYEIQKGTVLSKGRKTETYKNITRAAAEVTDRCGCYSWGGSAGIFYCGSFAPEKMPTRFKSSFQRRVHNYLQNHGSEIRSDKTPI